MLKGFRYRIYPNETQKQDFARHFGCARWVYNWALARRDSHYKSSKQYLSHRILQDELVALKKTEDKSWLNEVNSQSLLAALMNLDTAYQNFFAKRAKFPNFKKKYSGIQSFQCPQHVKINVEKQLIDLPKIKNISVKLHQKFEGKIKTCTIKQTPTQKYFISILVETPEIEPLPTVIEPNKTIGIDLGIKEFLITSEGYIEPNHRFLRNGISRLKKQQRKLSKMKRNSKNRIKAKLKLAKLHEKIANQRRDMVHQISARLVYKSHDTCFAVEDLNIKGMMSNHKLSQAIGDCAWGYLLDVIKYKAVWVGKNMIVVDRFSPTSKQCSNCGNIKEDLTLAVRSYECNCCSMICDRDLNAARNIKAAALRKIGLEWPEFKPVDHALTGVSVKRPSNSWVETGSRHYSEA